MPVRAFILRNAAWLSPTVHRGEGCGARPAWVRAEKMCRLILRRLSLTPALSRWEREQVSQRSSSRARWRAMRLNAVLPLPAGEGRGEGEHKTLRAHTLFHTSFARPWTDHVALFLTAACALHAAVISENFSTNPRARGWKNFGDTNLFRWNATNQNLEVTWDSARTNSFFQLHCGRLFPPATSSPSRSICG